ncbi:MAG: hypothetical protein H0U73_03390 [Tatlockia sp.]|nr:hypothetical protein [Tatlockia sp.]
MYHYFHTTKTSGKSIFFRLGYNSKNEFEFYYSEDMRNWNQIEVIFKENLYELKQTNSTDKVTFNYSEELNEIVLNCDIEKESRISFYNDNHEKASLAFVNFYELALVKISPSSLPFDLREYKFSSDWDRSTGSLKDWLTTDEELSCSPRGKEEQERDSLRENDLIEETQTDISEEDSCDEGCLNISMFTLGLFGTILGSGGVAIALTLLEIKTAMGLTTAIVSGLVGSASFLFFTIGASRSCKESIEEPMLKP